ncbi:FGGY family carbohydrate kinase [Algivirga pacifica]|uniref:Sugar (Pentulose or hexulose) kinase n=1 Tax=Algivirga pacifica TaxID=1162670 RepID=A0ABP9DCF8_9BACT
MSRKEVILVFDIGKTNKKLFVFDREYAVVEKEYQRFPEQKDEEGFPTEDLKLLKTWVKERSQFYFSHPVYVVVGMNFSTYGASFVLLDQGKRELLPMYNYLKPFPEYSKKWLFTFFEGGKEQFEKETSSPFMGMLNSGNQLLWLKQEKPAQYRQVNYVLHLPQYFHYLMTGEMVQEYTSLGCHTGMWDFRAQQMAKWLEKALPEITWPEVEASVPYRFVKVWGQSVKVGMGIHDSSAALLPYRSLQEPFVLISTGTWSICMNPFNHQVLTLEELHKDCLLFLSPEGKSVKASRLMLGKEYALQEKKLADYFGKEKDYHHGFSSQNEMVIPTSFQQPVQYFRWNFSYLRPDVYDFNNQGEVDFSSFECYEEAYLHLMHELVTLQVASLRLVLEGQSIRHIYVDGGFIHNKVYLRLLKGMLPEFSIKASVFGNASAIGAAILVNDRAFEEEKVYQWVEEEVTFT